MNVLRSTGSPSFQIVDSFLVVFLYLYLFSRLRSRSLPESRNAFRPHGERCVTPARAAAKETNICLVSKMIEHLEHIQCASF